MVFHTGGLHLALYAVERIELNLWIKLESKTTTTHSIQNNNHKIIFYIICKHSNKRHRQMYSILVSGFFIQNNEC
jgi:hypothetical protein